MNLLSLLLASLADTSLKKLTMGNHALQNSNIITCIRQMMVINSL